MDGCRERIPLMCVDEKKREEVNSGNGPDTMALPFFASWTRLEGTTFLM